MDSVALSVFTFAPRDERTSFSIAVGIATQYVPSGHEQRWSRTTAAAVLDKCSEQEWLYDGRRLLATSNSARCIQIDRSGATDASCYIAAVGPGLCLEQAWIFEGERIKSALDQTMCLQVEGATVVVRAVDESAHRAQAWTIVDTLDQNKLVPLASLSSVHVYQLLSALEYSQCKQTFLDQDINGAALVCCTTDRQLQDIGVASEVKAQVLLRELDDMRLHGVPVCRYQSRPLPYAMYRIQSVKNPSMCLEWDSIMDGAPCSLRPAMVTAAPEQLWCFRKRQIIPMKLPDKVLHVSVRKRHARNGDECSLSCSHCSPYCSSEWIYDGKLLRSAKDPSLCIHAKSGGLPTPAVGDTCHLWRVVYGPAYTFSGDSIALLDVVPGDYLPQEWLFDGKLLRSAKYPSKCIRTKKSSDRQGRIWLGDMHVGVYLAQEWTIKDNVIRSVKYPTKCIKVEERGKDVQCVLGPIVPGSLPLQEWTIKYLTVIHSPSSIAALVPLDSLSCAQVYQLLAAIEFRQYNESFMAMEINGHALACCTTVEDAAQLGVLLKPKARSLLRSIEQFSTNGVSIALFAHEPLPKCAYRFQSTKHPTKCLQLMSGGGLSRNGDLCHIAETKSTEFPAQVWLFDGKLIKSAKDPTKCIHLKGNSVFNGQPVHLHAIVEYSWPNQEWLYDGKLIRSLKDPTKCIRLASGDDPCVSGGDLCQLWDIISDGPYPAQEWKLVPDKRTPLGAN
ncbi:hypothetical protein ACHHYP_14293 [Achlya hypogyna]|uniref:SAM domain-containing protein n=1 Tax=Achlya hypogyna TaxID=1202772 RepID=A0A1V9YDL1_ACHHY|nr:hypothetical protein ACHHYP_14293 [Achlya hypogyna]